MRYANTLFTMTSFLGGFLIAGVASAQLHLGDAVPGFKCLDDQGLIWDSRERLGKNVTVVYFYPSDFAFCCTRQAKGYRDIQSELKCLGVEVIGISGDVVAAHRMFQETHGLDHRLLADWEGNVARTFEVPLRFGGKAMPTDASGNALIGSSGAAVRIPRDFTASRWTFVVDMDRRVIYCDTDVSPKKDPQEVLQFLCEWSSKVKE